MAVSRTRWRLRVGSLCFALINLTPPSKQEVVQRSLCSLSPLVFFLFNLVLGAWKELGWDKGWKDGRYKNPIK